MKNITKKILGAVCISVIMTGCTDLSYENFSQINSENFPVSESDLEASAIGVYNTLANSLVMQWLNNAGWTYSELPTDELNTGWGRHMAAARTFSMDSQQHAAIYMLLQLPERHHQGHKNHR